MCVKNEDWRSFDLDVKKGGKFVFEVYFNKSAQFIMLCASFKYLSKTH